MHKEVRGCNAEESAEAGCSLRLLLIWKLRVKFFQRNHFLFIQQQSALHSLLRQRIIKLGIALYG